MYSHSVINLEDGHSAVSNTNQLNASQHVHVTDTNGAAMEVYVTFMGSSYDLHIKLIPGLSAVGPGALLQLFGLKELGKKLSGFHRTHHSSHVSVEYQGDDLLRNQPLRVDGAWQSQQGNLFCFLGGLNPLKLSLRGISLTEMDIFILSQRFGSLTTLELLAMSEFSPAALKHLKALPHLRQLTVDATICCQSETAAYADEMSDVLKALCSGPIGNRGLVTLQYKCAADDPDESCYYEDLIKLAESVKGCIGEVPEVEFTVEMVPA